LGATPLLASLAISGTGSGLVTKNYRSIRSNILTQDMTSSNIFGHTPFWTWNPILDISGTGIRLVTKIQPFDSQ
jgi:hypothetical protein